MSTWPDRFAWAFASAALVMLAVGESGWAAIVMAVLCALLGFGAGELLRLAILGVRSRR